MRKLSALAALLALAGSAQAQPSAAPVVLELFTSQGCSSCPPADAQLARFADRPDVIALSFGVTYWDRLGWKDIFAKPEFTERQYAYARRFGGGSYTPEMVAGGRVHGVGNTSDRVQALIARGRTKPLTSVSAGSGEVRVAAGVAPRGGADVWLVRYDPRMLAIPVKAGENNGKTLPVRNVVRQLKRLGGWTGEAAAFPVPPDEAGLSSVVLVQGRAGGPILAAGRI